MWNCKGDWTSHLRNIYDRGCKRIDMFRGLKMKLDRQTLNTIYLSFIRPIFEYASVVWHNTPRHEKYFDDLERLQLECARIVRGTNRYASKQLLYIETAWDTLSIRRDKQRLFLFFQIHNGLAPQHLLDAFNSYRTRSHARYVRFSDNYQYIFARTESFRCSFFPHAIRLWNSLDISIKTDGNFNSFKRKIDKLFLQKKEIVYYLLGNRSINSVMATFRTKCSQIKDDLFKNGIIDSNSCTCGATETVYHYFFECENFVIQRDTLFTDTLFVPHLSLSIILHGHPDFTNNQNILLFDAVFKYVKSTKGFVNVT